MKIEELIFYGEHITKPLIDLYHQTGNTTISGYLGEELKDLNINSRGDISCYTVKEKDEMEITSNIVSYGNNNVLIAEEQKGHDNTYYRMYSWDTNEMEYTFIEFDNPMSMRDFYRVIPRFNKNLCEDDISSMFQEMGLRFDNVTQIKLNQQVNPMEDMFLEEEEENIIKR